MNEKAMKLRLRKIIAVVVITIIALTILGGVVASHLRKALIEENAIQLQTETNQYIDRMNRQIARDLEMLYTIGGFVEGLEEKQEIQALLERLIRENEFTSIMYFEGDEGIVVSLTDETKHVTLDSLHSECQNGIRISLTGECAISQPFDSSFTGQSQVAYSIPVYRDESETGVLMGLDPLQTFSEILDVYGILGGSGYVHLIDNEGNFLIYSRQAVLKVAPKSLFNGLYFPEERDAQIREDMKKGRDLVFEFQHEGKTYHASLKPVGINGWYLMGVSTSQNINHPMYRIAAAMLGLFLGLLLLVVWLLVYGSSVLRKNYEELLFMTYRDNVSGLYNRPGFLKRAGEAIEKDPLFSIAAINIRKFKYINEVFGQEKADQLLRQIGDKITTHLESGELACRSTGDTFFLFLREWKRKEVERRLKEILKSLEQCTDENQTNFQLQFYCGCVIQEKKMKDEFNKLITHLMFTLSKARELKTDMIYFYDKEVYDKLQMESYMEKHAKEAMERGEFKMFLQPKIDLKTNRLHGAEALVRWFTAEGKQIFPDQFIPLFEQNGFCVLLDLYMVECACRQIRSWIDAGIQPVGISVNQTKLLFYEPTYIERLTEIVNRYRIPVELITLEILEGIAIENLEQLNDKIDQLKRMGFQVSMDDFGSGYSSLNVLSKLHIDELKIDREFLRDLISDQEGRTEVVLQQVVHMTKGLKMSTVVEGVETQEQEELVARLGCDYSQGYYYSRPISQDEFNEKYMNEEA